MDMNDDEYTIVMSLRKGGVDDVSCHVFEH